MHEITKFLKLPLDVVVIKKIGAPDDSEFAIGAVREEEQSIFDSEVIALYNISQEYIQKKKQNID